MAFHSVDHWSYGSSRIHSFNSVFADSTDAAIRGTSVRFVVELDGSMYLAKTEAFSGLQGFASFD